MNYVIETEQLASNEIVMMTSVTVTITEALILRPY